MAGFFFAIGNNFLSNGNPSTVTIALTVGILVVSQGAVWWKRNSQLFPTSVRLLSLIIIGHVFLMQLIYRELRPYSAYYFAPELFWAATVATLYVTRGCQHLAGQKPNFPGKSFTLWGWRAIPLAFAILSLWLMSTLWREQTFQPSPYWVERMQIIRDVQQILPDTNRISAFWPGTFAQFSGKFVTPLDGIIGSNDFFQQYVKPSRQIDYILERSRPHVIVFLTASPDRFYAQPELSLTPWDIGTIRVWELGAEAVRILAARPINSEGTGWYLLELKEQSSCQVH